MIPKEAYIALGIFLLLAGLAFGFNRMLAHQYAKGEEAGSAIATAKCGEELDKIQLAADTERRRLGKIALDLGLELAKKERARVTVTAQLKERSEHEINNNPAPAVCDWSDERVRIINDAARGIGPGGEGAPGSRVP